MTTTKYEWLHDNNAQRPGRAVHRRLGREVFIHSISLVRLHEADRDRVRQWGTRLARLDHPFIPHLVDFRETDGSYQVVLESFDGPFELESLTFFEALERLGQVCDALSHAWDRGIYHGALRAAHLHVDHHGHIKLVGLGFQQIEEGDRELHRLAQADLLQVSQWVGDCLERVAATSERQVTAQPLQDLRRLVNSARHDPCRSKPEFYSEYHEWLQCERDRREADRLAIRSDVDVPGVRPDRRSTWSVMALIGFASLVLVGLLVTALWPTTKPIIGADVAKPSAGDAPSQPTLSAKEARAPEFVSDLGNVGVLNNPDAVGLAQPVDLPAVDPEGNRSLSSMNDATVGEGKDSKKSEEALDAQEGQMLTAAPVKSEAEMGSPTDDRGGQGLVVLADPFQDTPRAVELPPLTETKPVDLVTWASSAGDALELELVGGVGAHRTGEFLLDRGEQGTWEVIFQDETRKRIAALEGSDGRLRFAWIPVSPTPPSAWLRNTVLLLAIGQETHSMALRGYEQRPAIEVDLERRKPFSLQISHPPDDRDVVVEFLRNEDSLALALPKSIICVDEQMRIGLDAGKQSRVVLQVEPQFRGRKQQLLIHARLRTTPEAPFMAVAAGTGSSLRAKLMQMNQALYRLKITAGKAKGDIEDRLELQVRQLQRDKEAFERFLQSYAAASQQHLRFRIYRQVGPHRIPLLAIGE